MMSEEWLSGGSSLHLTTGHRLLDQVSARPLQGLKDGSHITEDQEDEQYSLVPFIRCNIGPFEAAGVPCQLLKEVDRYYC